MLIVFSLSTVYQKRVYNMILDWLNLINNAVISNIIIDRMLNVIYCVFSVFREL